MNSENTSTSQSTRIYTKKGDLGMTSFLSGEKIYKDNIRVEAYGTLDELNSTLGYAGNMAHPEIREVLNTIQYKLFGIASHIALKDPQSEIVERLPRIDEAYIEHMERVIDQMTSAMPPLANFILPGATAAGGAIAIARTTCRRAERRLVTLHQAEGVEEIYLKFINRLSDLLFTLERFEYHLSGIEPKKWMGK